MVSHDIKLKIVSLNFRGLRSPSKRKAIITWLQNQKADIVFLKKTNSIKEVENFWSSQWDDGLFFAHGTEHARGVGLSYIKKD